MILIEEQIIFLLKAGGVKVYAEEQEDKDLEYVVVIKNDAGVENLLATSNVFLQCYSTSLYKASMLCERVKNIMSQMVQNKYVTSCRIENSYPESKQETKQYRYIAEYIINYYA